jgi:putative NADPH-quinone reductase
VGNLPALLKGFLDRVMTPHFAFITCEGGTGDQGLLGGRSAQLITTMDTPPLIHRLVYRQPGPRALPGQPARALAQSKERQQCDDDDDGADDVDDVVHEMPLP